MIFRSQRPFVNSLQARRCRAPLGLIVHLVAFLQGLPCLAEADVSATAPAAAVIKLEPDSDHPAIRFLSWDTEGGHRAAVNLLRAPLFIGWRAAKAIGKSSDVPLKPQRADAATVRYRIPLIAGAELTWTVARTDGGLMMTFEAHGDAWPAVDGVTLVLPLDPRTTPTTVLPAEWREDGSLRLPAVVSAPDFGQMLLTGREAPRLSARLEGARSEKVVDFTLEIPPPLLRQPLDIEMRPVYLAPPAGLKDITLWRLARRGWFSAFQSTARWGDQNRPFSAPPGILGNNVLSDPASMSLVFYADQALWTPQLAPGVSAMNLVRRSLEFWLDHRVRPGGEMIGYWDYTCFLDANAAPATVAWDYVEATGDLDWLRGRIERIEFVTEYLARRDIDGDGLVEATQSGNANTLQQPARSCAWWDALNCGHKDGYTNAVIYRAWRCLADLERRLGRTAQAERFAGLADRLKAAYARTLLNPQSGWLAWWKSRDGRLHDLASPVVNGMAIEYGLVNPEQARAILRRLNARIREVGFTRFDLGVPPMLVPVPRADYLQPNAFGLPQKEDGTDTFQQYMNGGISAAHVLPWLVAHHVVGMPEEADRILRAMLQRQQSGAFQNGVQDRAHKGIDWTTWDGKPCGYEGYLADVYRFLLAIPLREESLRARFYRPLR